MNKQNVLEILKSIDHPDNINDKSLCFLTLGGSRALGLHNEDSDYDIYGFCIPSFSECRPFIYNHIYGFGPSPNVFQSFSNNHINYEDKKYDITIHSVIRFCHLAWSGNPSITNSLFSEEKNILYKNKLSSYLLKNKREFLSKSTIAAYVGYSTSQYYEYEKTGNIKSLRAAIKSKYDLKSIVYNEIFDLEEYKHYLENPSEFKFDYNSFFNSVEENRHTYKKCKKILDDILTDFFDQTS